MYGRIASICWHLQTSWLSCTGANLINGTAHCQRAIGDEGCFEAGFRLSVGVQCSCQVLWGSTALPGVALKLVILLTD